MRRRLFNILAAVSVVMGLATVVLWLRSYWISEAVRWDSNQSYEIGASAGALVFHVYKSEVRSPLHHGHHLRFIRYGGSPIDRRWSYLHRVFRDFRRQETYFFLSEDRGFGSYCKIPFWPILVSTLLLPAVAFRRMLRERKRRRAGLCIQCGYDLRATRDRCPECGTPVPAGNVPKL